MQRISLSIVIAIAIACPALHAQDFKKQVIYQVVTDRFANGDPSNDNPAQSLGLFDATHTNWQASGAAIWPASSSSLPTSRGWAPRPSGSRRL